MKTKQPSIRAQLLGKLLREYRGAAGVAARDAGMHIQRDQSMMSRLEAGHVCPPVPAVPRTSARCSNSTKSVTRPSSNGSRNSAGTSPPRVGETNTPTC